MTEDLFAAMRLHVLAALRAAIPGLPEDVLERVEVTPAREAAHGDMATNGALVAAKPARQPPQELAQAIVAHLMALPEVASAEPAGPGFVNIRLHPAALLGTLPAILRAGEAFGDGAPHGRPVNVEYVSANPTGPMHVGHCRGAVVGDALANLLKKSGRTVVKEFYINDAGNQVTALAWATYWRYLEAIGTPLTREQFADQVPGGLQYGGAYLIPIGQELAAMRGRSLASDDLGIAAPELWIDTVRDFAVASLLGGIREDLAALGVRHDLFTSERALVESGAVDAVVQRLADAGLLYEGVLEPPKGKTPDDWEPREQLLFRATAFGDDVDRPLRKSDGSYTYFANDVAYHADKIARGFPELIDVWGADHGGYVQRMKAAVAAVGGRDGAAETARLDVVLCQIVHVLRGGEPVRMSKRAGTFVALRDLIDEVGADTVRFTMLTRKSDAQMEFDLEQAVAQTRDNPVFYVQYAHARCRSVLRAAAEMFGTEAAKEEALALVPLDTLGADAELAVIRRLIAWPRTVRAAAVAREPHRIAFFLYDLAGDFHMLWNRGRDDSTLRFLQADRLADSLARLALVAAVAIVIRSGLAVMGVAPVEEMR